MTKIDGEWLHLTPEQEQASIAEQVEKLRKIMRSHGDSGHGGSSS
jgi:hypothetical protein